MNVSKINYNGQTLIDLTSDTVSASTLLIGGTSHIANGDIIDGNFNSVESAFCGNETSVLNLKKTFMPHETYYTSITFTGTSNGYIPALITDFCPMANDYNWEMVNLIVRIYRPCDEDDDGSRIVYHLVIHNPTDQSLYCEEIRYVKVMVRREHLTIWEATERRTIVSPPTITSEPFVYDGTEKTPTVSEYDPEIMEVTIVPQTDAGDYYVIAHLIDGDNYIWEGYHTSDRKLKWTIEPITISTPSVTGSFTYDGTEKSPTIGSYDTNIIELDSSSVTAATNAGDYDIIFNIIDRNYKFEE